MNFSPSQRQTMAWIGLALVAAVMLWLLAPVVTPFVVGAVLAYALHPLVEALARRRVPRLLAVLVVEVAALVLVLALALLIVPVIGKEVPQLKAQIPPLLDKLNQNLSPWLAQWGIQISLDLASLKSWAAKLLDANLEDWVGTVLSSARLGGSVVLSLVGNAILVPVVLFYLLADWSSLVARAQALIPPRMREPGLAFLDECDQVLGQYMRGQALVMGALVIYYSIALALAGFDLALALGVFTGLAIAIPYVGFGIGLVLALLAGVLQFGALKGLLLVLAVYGVGQLLEGFVLTPRLVGERIGLNPLAVIFALLAFGTLFGFVGVLVALPASAVVLVALRRARQTYLSSRLYTG
jgi:predicted PurR-regulated permease PerM